MADRLSEYRSKRSFDQTPEPSGDGGTGDGSGGRFVVHEHHARRLHWDLRLEHDGVLLSWALPRGVPDDPKQNRLAVHTEDHPLDYIDFEGTIPKGQYGAGEISVWDSGTYEAEKLRADEVIATFSGERMRGRYAIFQTRGKDWMIHRMDPPAEGEPMPGRLEPMKATLAKLPSEEEGWGFEIKWDGVRALAYCTPGHVRLESRTLREITAQYPEIRGIAEPLGARKAILDGEIVAFGEDGRPSFQRLQTRMHVGSEAEVRKRRARTPVVFVAFDLLHLDGRSLLDEPYSERREALEALELNGPAWQTPRFHPGDGAALLEASRRQGLEGIVAKRLESTYTPGRRSRAWLKIKNVRSQEVVIGGWIGGKGNRSGELGALAAGLYEDGELRYAGKVGTGFAAADLKLLRERLEPLARDDSPFAGRQPQKDTRFVDPTLVAEVEFGEWTNAGTMRHPSYKGLREDKPAADVVREEPAET